VVSRSDIDLVDVCTPNPLHALMACAAADYGRAVICEKPLATNVEDATRMTQAVERAGVPNAVMFNYRYAPAVRQAHDLIAAGAIGKLREFRFHFFQD
jgi:predicted dehydrogenase